VPPLTPNQRAAVEHAAGPLAVVGGPGTGKTTVLIERFAWLCGAPEAVLVLSSNAEGLRPQIEARLDRGFEELHVHSLPGFCSRLLHDEAIEAGLGPFAATASAADRLAMLLDRIDELSVRLHDFRGSPAAMLAGIVARIDRLKDNAISAQAYADWALTQEDEREREFAQIYLAHDRMLGEQSLLDGGELVLQATALLEGKPRVRERTHERFAHVLVDDVEDLTPAQRALLGLLGESLTVTSAASVDGLEAITLDSSLRCRRRILEAAGSDLAGAPGGEDRKSNV